MAETCVDRRTKHWYNEREALEEKQLRQTPMGRWATKHPGACFDCGRRLSAHKKLGDCAAFQAEGYAHDLGWDAGYNGRARDNPYFLTVIPKDTVLWNAYEGGYQEGAAFKEDHQC